MTPEERKQKALKGNLCIRCLEGGHVLNECSNKVFCSSCGLRHCRLICGIEEVMVQLTGGVRGNNRALLPTGHATMVGKSKNIVAKFLLDSGVQRSFASKQLANDLKLKPVSHEWVSVHVFGDSAPAPPQKLPLVVLSIDNGKGQVFRFQTLVVETISQVEPSPVPVEIRNNIQVQLAEMLNEPSKIDVLLGASDMMSVLTGEIIRKGSLTLLATHFGYVAVKSSDARVDVSALTVASDSITLEDFWRIEHLGILPSELDEPIRDSYLLETKFSNTVRQTTFGKHSTVINVDKKMVSQLSDNAPVARRQWIALVKRLNGDSQLHTQYASEVNSFINAGYAEIVPTNEIPRYFLPHFPVINPNKTSFKVRPVFNASSHAKEKLSLNDCILDVLNLLPTPFDSILRFRTNAVALIGDISKAYLQVEIHEEFRNLLGFYWNGKLERNSGESNIYRMKVNTFGVKDAQFNTISVIRYHAEKFKQTKSAAAHALQEHIYMDDLLSGSNDSKSALALWQDVSDVLAEAEMQMKKWRSNSKEVNEAVSFKLSDQNTPVAHPQTEKKVLGIVWEDSADKFGFDPEPLMAFLKQAPPTKRTLLGALPRLYDPPGFLAPVSMTLKLMLQDLHKLKVSLDEQLPLDIMKKWVNWCSELENSKKFSVERWLFKGLADVTSKELEIFVDASDRAYAAVVYIQSKDSKSNTHRAFVACKARAVPIKQLNLTIPKKELLAAMCGARLGTHVAKILKMEHEPQRFWSDSRTVLSWIGAEKLDKLGVFVKNRVSEIRKLTKQSQWSHISGVDNPADMPSRGLSVSKLLESQIWLKGPSTIPAGEAVNVMPVAMPSCMKNGRESDQGKENIGFPIEGYSSFHKVVRIAAFVNRAVNLLKAGGLEKRRRTFKQGPPTVADGPAFMQPELLAAKHRLLKDAQRRCFGEGLQQLKDGEQIEDAKLRDFHPFIDSDGLVRVGGRLELP